MPERRNQETTGSSPLDPAEAERADPQVHRLPEADRPNSVSRGRPAWGDRPASAGAPGPDAAGAGTGAGPDAPDAPGGPGPDALPVDEDLASAAGAGAISGRTVTRAPQHLAEGDTLGGSGDEDPPPED